jgi:hypothetical protein
MEAPEEYGPPRAAKRNPNNDRVKAIAPVKPRHGVSQCHFVHERSGLRPLLVIASMLDILALLNQIVVSFNVFGCFAAYAGLLHVPQRQAFRVRALHLSGVFSVATRP